MAYEPDMTIIFDVNSKGVAVSFRGKVIYLPGPYPDRKAVSPPAKSFVESWAGWTSSHGWAHRQRFAPKEAHPQRKKIPGAFVVWGNSGIWSMAQSGKANRHNT
jgi:hypothetical protein